MNRQTILLVEDDRVDALTVKRAFNELRITNRLEVAKDGQEALDMLQNGDKEKPGLILLDLNMPRMSGVEFLKHRRKHKSLRRIPVVVLTTSREEQDRMNSFDLCISGYMIKPVDYRKFVETIKAIKLYWTISQTPE